MRRDYIAIALVSIVCLLVAPGCTHTTYTDPSGAQFSRTTVFSSQQLGDVKVTAGDKTLSIGTLNTTQAEATGALLGAALKAAGK